MTSACQTRANEYYQHEHFTVCCDSLSHSVEADMLPMKRIPRKLQRPARYPAKRASLADGPSRLPATVARQPPDNDVNDYKRLSTTRSLGISALRLREIQIDRMTSLAMSLGGSSRAKPSGVQSDGPQRRFPMALSGPLLAQSLIHAWACLNHGLQRLALNMHHPSESVAPSLARLSERAGRLWDS